MNGDFCGDVFVRIVGEILADGSSEFYFSGLHELERGHGGKHFVHGADAETGVQFVFDFLFAIGQAVGAGKNAFAVFRDHHGAGKMIGGDLSIDFGTKRGDGLVFGYARKGEFGGSGDGVQIELLDLVRFGGVNFDFEARKLVGIALLHNGGEMEVVRLFHFLEFKSAGHGAESHHAVNFLRVVGIIFLEECEEYGAVATVEGIEPGAELPSGWGARGFGLCGRSDSEGRTG